MLMLMPPRIITRQLSEWPELLFLRDRYDLKINDGLGSNFIDDRHHDVHPDGLPSYATLLHAACQVCHIPVHVLALPVPSLPGFSSRVKFPPGGTRGGSAYLSITAKSFRFASTPGIMQRSTACCDGRGIRSAGLGFQGPAPGTAPIDGPSAVSSHVLPPSR